MLSGTPVEVGGGGGGGSTSFSVQPRTASTRARRQSAIEACMGRAGRTIMAHHLRPHGATKSNAGQRRTDVDTIPGFRYIDGQLSASDVPLQRALDAMGSAWVYDSAGFDARGAALVRAFDPSWARACYAVKANTNPALLRRARAHGLGAEVSSGGELKLAL